MNLNDLTIYKSKKVLVTGHTGFKGSWLAQWLLMLNAEVNGFALEPPTNPSLYNQLNLNKYINNNTNDVRDIQELKKFIRIVKPDIIFHLAAQSLVRESYRNPIDTIETNIIGTANLLDAVRQLGISTNIVVITSDKCYENKEWVFGYRENDPMGGYDPYSVSKGAAELIVSSWRRSFFSTENYAEHGVKIASARAGNVIGGGDWADDRIVPDCVRALQSNKEISIRNPLATRPWQHVLEPIGAYLLLGSKLLTAREDNINNYCTSFNFGPSSTSNKTVELLITEIIKNWGKGTWNYKKDNALHEAFLLNLSTDKAYHTLGWQPVWDFKTTVKNTIEWYKTTLRNSEKVVEITDQQIKEYTEAMHKNYGN